MLGSGPVTVTINVGSVNDAPVAGDDTYSTNEDTILNIAAPGVLTNDTDADMDSLTVSLIAPPANGNVSLLLDGSFSYTPNANFNGADTFVYEISDGNLGTDTATVTINVGAVNDVPELFDDSYTTAEDTPLSVDAMSGVLANDIDVDGDGLTASIVIDPANGSVVLSSDGSFDYTPDANFNGTDTFTYRASDGTLDAIALVTISVTSQNDPRSRSMTATTVPRMSSSPSRRRSVCSPTTMTSTVTR